MDFQRNMEVFDARLYHPSTMLIAGPSSSGKFSNKNDPTYCMKNVIVDN